MQAPNISFKDYHVLADKSEYDKFIKFLKPKDVLNIGEFLELSFGFVKDMQTHFNTTGITWPQFLDEMSKLTFVIHGITKGKTVKHLASMSVYEINQQLLYCQDQIKVINNIESKTLAHKPDADEVAANIKRFSKYGGWMQIHKISGFDRTKHDLIRSYDYMSCFIILAYDFDNVSYTKDLQNIKNKKNKS